MSHLARARLAVAIVFFAVGSLVGTWASRIPDIKSYLGLSEAGFGVLLLIMAVGGILSFPLSGRAIDRFGGVTGARVGVALCFVFFALVPLAGSVWVIAPILAAFGAIIGASDVAMNAWAAEVEKAMAKPIMSSFHGLYSLGAGVGAGFGGLTISLGWSVTTHIWVVLAVLSVICLIFVRVPWTSETHETTGKRPPLVALPRGGLIFIGGMAFCAAVSEGSAVDWAALYQIQELGIAPSMAAIGFSVFSVAMVGMRFAGDFIIARFGQMNTAIASGITAGIGAMIFVLGSDPYVIWLGCGIMGLGNAVIFPIAFSRAAADPDMSPGEALAAVSTLGYGAFLFGPPLIGFIAEASSLRASFVLIAVLSFLIAVFAALGRRQERRML